MTGTIHTRSSDTTIRLEHVRRDDARTGGASRTEIPTVWSPIRSADNVVPFARPRHGEGPSRAAAFALVPGQRSAPAWVVNESRVRMAALMALSLAAHIGFFTFSWRDVAPLDSVSVETISIEIVLGGETVAGAAETPAEVEAEAAPPVEEVKPDEQVVEE